MKIIAINNTPLREVAHDKPRVFVPPTSSAAGLVVARLDLSKCTHTVVEDIDAVPDDANGVFIEYAGTRPQRVRIQNPTVPHPGVDINFRYAGEENNLWRIAAGLTCSDMTHETYWAAVGFLRWCESAGIRSQMDWLAAALPGRVPEYVPKITAFGQNPKPKTIRTPEQIQVALEVFAAIEGEPRKTENMPKNEHADAVAKYRANLTLSDQAMVWYNRACGPADNSPRMRTKRADKYEPKGGTMEDSTGQIKAIPALSLKELKAMAGDQKNIKIFFK